jgi:hypothetical protein
MKSVVSLIFIAQLLVIANAAFLKTNSKQEPVTNQNQAGASENTQATQTTTTNNNDKPVVTEQKAVIPETSGEEKKLIDAFCFINTNGTVYDLNNLKNDEGDYLEQGLTGNVHFNICRNSFKSCGDKGGMASFVGSINGDNCVQLAGNYTVSSKFSLITDESKNKTTLRMTLPEGDICKSDDKKRYQTTIDFTCDPEAEAPIIPDVPININSCTNKIFVSSKYACPKMNVYALWNKIQDNKWIFGAILIGLGIFFCFFGENFLKVTQVIAGGALVLLIFLYLIFSQFSVGLYTWHFWVIVIIAVGLGCLAGWFMSKITWLPGLVFGCLLGFVIGFFIFNLCLRFIHSNPIAVFWITMVTCIILGCLLGFYKEEEIAIISTSFVGAYGIVRGLSIWFGGFPDERQVYELGNNGEWDQMKQKLTAVVYAYLAGFVVLAVLGMYIQFKYFYDGDKKKNKKDEEKPLNQKEENSK